MSGFQDASITKGLMLTLGISSLAISLLDLKPYLHLILSPHMTKYHQFYRIIVHPIAFANSIELLLGEVLLYQVGVAVERAFGARKYASFLLASSAVSTFFSFALIVLFHRFGLNYIPAGPYGIVFSLIWQHYRITPSLYSFVLFGLEFSSKAFVWLLSSQLVLSDPPSSLVAATVGLVVGYLYRADTLLVLPSLSRRRVFRPLKSFRIPLSLFILLSRIFTPLIGTSAPPRRANRVLPGQVSDSSARSTATQGLSAPTLRSLLGARNAPRDTAPTTPVPPVSAGTATRARAAVGELVNEMTGRGEGGARPPTEQEIATLTTMFPNLGRDVIVRALQRSNHNTAMAVEALLQHGS